MLHDVAPLRNECLPNHGGLMFKDNMHAAETASGQTWASVQTCELTSIGFSCDGVACVTALCALLQIH